MVRDALSSQAARERGAVLAGLSRPPVRGRRAQHITPLRARSFGRSACWRCGSRRTVSEDGRMVGSEGQRGGDGAYRHRLQRKRDQGMMPPITAFEGDGRPRPEANAVLDCGWGRLLFGQTFDDPPALVDALRGRRTGPPRHRLLRPRSACAPVDRAAGAVSRSLAHLPARSCHLPVEPPHAARLLPPPARLGADAEAVNRIYASRQMVPVPPDFFWSKRRQARDQLFRRRGRGDAAMIVGTVTGVDHGRAFGDPEDGASLWCLAVDPQARAARHRRSAGPPPGRAFQGAGRRLPRSLRPARQ